jgi:hypothetical protein
MHKSKSTHARTDTHIDRLETKLARAFSAEELVRLPYLQFRHLRVTLQGKAHLNVCLSLSEEGLCLFDSVSGTNIAAITCEEEIQV